MSDGLTAEQRAAIECLDADVCVAAGAGSGKTRVLAERFLRLTSDARRQTPDASRQPTGSECEEGAEPEPLASADWRLPTAVDQILAITFTRKAAQEMKARIARALEAQGRTEERRRLEVGYISTIHTFCERVLRENPFEAGLDPDFVVLDEAEAALLLDQAYERVLEAAFARVDDPVADLAQACYDRLMSDGEDGVVRLRKNMAAHLQALSSLGWSPEDVAGWAGEPAEWFEEQALAALVAALEPVLALFREAGAVLGGLSLVRGAMEERRQALVAGCGELGFRVPDGPHPQPLPWKERGDYASCHAEVRGAIRTLPLGREALPDDQPSGPVLSFAEVEERLGRLRALSGQIKLAAKVKEAEPAAYEVAREQFLRMREGYARIEKWAEEWSAEGERRSQARARAGLELLARLWREYEGLKRERAALDFSDLQRGARDLLRDAPAVRGRLRARLRYLMVDEFQDTDRLQVELLDLLRGERNLFFVGDSRQSIYRFRHAEVGLFREREQAVREREAREPGAARRLALATNFRSRPEILAFVNGLFGRLWGSPRAEPRGYRAETPAAPGSGGAARGGGLAREAVLPAFESLLAGRGFDAKAASCVDLVRVAGEGGAEAVRRAEAAAIARRVGELIAGGAVITRADHPRRGEGVRASDVVVLLRSMSSAAIYEQALAAAGLATYVVGGRQYYARREIRDVVNLLKTICRPLDDLAVAAALRSPFVGISLDTLTLLQIQARSHREEPRCLYRAIGPALEAQPIEAEDSARLRAFMALVERIREQEDRFRVGQILEIALAETGYAVEVLRRPGGRRTLANVRKLLQMANARGSSGVAAFVEEIEALTRVSEREGDAPTYAETADVVRLMTIHQAKGLEFPVVVLPDLGGRPRPQELPLLALDPEKRRAACRVGEGYEPPLHQVLAAADAAAEREEALRVLYVALTRAEEHLILAGPAAARAGTWAAVVWENLPEGVGYGEICQPGD